MCIFVFKKRIIVDVSQSGLGNRLLALTSASVLAAALDTVLELKWHRTDACGALFEELFKPHKEPPRFVPFIYGKFDVINCL